MALVDKIESYSMLSLTAPYRTSSRLSMQRLIYYRAPKLDQSTNDSPSTSKSSAGPSPVIVAPVSTHSKVTLPLREDPLNLPLKSVTAPKWNVAEWKRKGWSAYMGLKYPYQPPYRGLWELSVDPVSIYIH